MKINKKKLVFNIFIILTAITAGVYLYLNPTILSSINFNTKSNQQAVAPSNQEIYDLQNQIYKLKKDLSQIPNFNTKADIASVAVLQAQYKNLENKINLLEKELEKTKKTTSKNALILTSANMVKEAALMGQDYSSQAFLLQNLGASDPILKQDIAEINNIKKQAIKSDTSLINEFNTIYKQIIQTQKEEFEKHNKSTIKTKLDNFIKLKKVNKDSKQFTPNPNLQHIHTLVNNKHLYEAQQQLQNINNSDPKINEKLKIWQDNVLTKQRLANAINNIIANSIIAINFESLTRSN